jgi:hypothetical protein
MKNKDNKEEEEKKNEKSKRVPKGETPFYNYVIIGGGSAGYAAYKDLKEHTNGKVKSYFLILYIFLDQLVIMM